MPQNHIERHSPLLPRPLHPLMEIIDNNDRVQANDPDSKSHEDLTRREIQGIFHKEPIEIGDRGQQNDPGYRQKALGSGQEMPLMI